MVLRLRLRSNLLAGILRKRSFTAPARSADEVLFSSILQRPVWRWWPAIGSLALHAATIGGVAFVSDLIPQAEVNLVSRYDMRVIRFHAPAHSEPQPPTSSLGTMLPRADVASADESPSGGPFTDVDIHAAAVPDHESANPTPRRFQLPELAARTASAQILLQPDSTPDLPLNRDLRVPELLLWKPHLPSAPARKVFVAQRRALDPTRLQSLPAPPTLDPPNQAVQLAGLAFDGQSTKPAPLLARSPATTAPIRTGEGDAAPVPQIGPTGADGIDTLNILSIPQIPIPTVGAFQVSAANQGASVGGGINKSTGQAAGARGTGNGGGKPGAGQAGTLTASCSVPGPPRTESKIAEAGSGEGKDAGRSGETEIIDGRPVTKVVLPPNGHFSILVQASGSEAFPEAEGILSGKLVYTVYVGAGARKDWILQYCLPRDVERKTGRAGKIPPLEAPFPFMMLRPSLAFGPDTDFLMIRGIASALGRFDQLGYVIAPDEKAVADQLLHSLQQWQLRPAKLDGEPVAVEILLVIPREGA
jgi:hypothetical protein